jgi:preprotein translocase subunit SecG
LLLFVAQRVEYSVFIYLIFRSFKMNWLSNLIVVLQIVVALIMVVLILLQHGKGADMGASFGSGASGSLFGAVGSANFMSRSTAVCAALFFSLTLGLTYLSSENAKPGAGGSVLDRPGAAASAPLSGAALIPGAAALAASATRAAGVPAPSNAASPPLASASVAASPASAVQAVPAASATTVVKAVTTPGSASAPAK